MQYKMTYHLIRNVWSVNYLNKNQRKENVFAYITFNQSGKIQIIVTFPHTIEFYQYFAGKNKIKRNFSLSVENILMRKVESKGYKSYYIEGKVRSLNNGLDTGFPPWANEWSAARQSSQSSLSAQSSRALWVTSFGENIIFQNFQNNTKFLENRILLQEPRHWLMCQFIWLIIRIEYNNNNISSKYKYHHVGGI